MDFNALIAELRASSEDLPTDSADRSLLSSVYCNKACTVLDLIAENTDYDNIITGLWLVAAHYAEQLSYLKPVPALSELCFKLFRQCAKAVLNIQWQNLEEDSSLRQNFLASLANLHAKLVPLDFPRFRLLEALTENPWTNPTLAKVMGGEVEDNDKEEVRCYIEQEDPIILQLRVDMMLKENCEEYALNLCNSCLSHPELQSDLGVRKTQLSLLYKLGQEDKLQEECQKLSIQDAVRIIKQLQTSKTHRQICTVLAQTFMVQNWIRPSDMEANKELLRLWIRHQLLVDREQDQFKESVWAMAKLSQSTEQIIIFIDVLREECGETFLQLYVDMCIFAINVDKGQMETNKKEGNLEAAAARRSDMASICAKLSCLCHHASVKVARICALTSFALKPTEQSFTKIGTFYGQGTDCCNKCGRDRNREPGTVNPATLYEVERLLNMLRPDYLSPDQSYINIQILCRRFLQESLKNAQLLQRKQFMSQNTSVLPSVVDTTQVDGPGNKLITATSCRPTNVFEALSSQDFQNTQILLNKMRLQNISSVKNPMPVTSPPQHIYQSGTSRSPVLQPDQQSNFPPAGQANKPQYMFDAERVKNKQPYGVPLEQQHQYYLSKHEKELEQRRKNAQKKREEKTQQIVNVNPQMQQQVPQLLQQQQREQLLKQQHNEQVTQIIQTALKQDSSALQKLTQGASPGVVQAVLNIMKGTMLKQSSTSNLQQQQQAMPQHVKPIVSSSQHGNQPLPTVSTLLKPSLQTQQHNEQHKQQEPQQPREDSPPRRHPRPQLYAQPITVSASSNATPMKYQSPSATMLNSRSQVTQSSAVSPASSVGEKQQNTENFMLSKSHVEDIRQFMQVQMSNLQQKQISEPRQMSGSTVTLTNMSVTNSPGHASFNLTNRPKTTVELAEQAALAKLHKQENAKSGMYPQSQHLKSNSGQTFSCQPGQMFPKSNQQQFIPSTSRANTNVQLHPSQHEQHQKPLHLQQHNNTFSFQHNQSSCLATNSVLSSSDELAGSIMGIDDTIIKELLQDSGILANTFPDIEVDTITEDKSRKLPEFSLLPQSVMPPNSIQMQKSSKAQYCYSAPSSPHTSYSIQSTQSHSVTKTGHPQGVASASYHHHSVSEINKYPQMRAPTSSASLLSLSNPNKPLMNQSALNTFSGCSNQVTNSPQVWSNSKMSVPPKDNTSVLPKWDIKQEAKPTVDQIREMMKKEDIQGEIYMDAANNATYRCIICSFAFETLDHLREHVRNVCKPGLQSSSVYNTKIKQDRANSAKAGVETTTVFQCLRCFELCVSDAGIKQHRLTCKRVPTVPSDLRKEAPSNKPKTLPKPTAMKQPQKKEQQDNSYKVPDLPLPFPYPSLNAEAVLKSMSLAGSFISQTHSASPAFGSKPHPPSTPPGVVPSKSHPPPVTPGVVPIKSTISTPAPFPSISSTTSISDSNKNIPVPSSAASFNTNQPPVITSSSNVHTVNQNPAPNPHINTSIISQKDITCLPQNEKLSTNTVGANVSLVESHLNQQDVDKLTPKENLETVSQPRCTEISGSGGSKFYKCGICSQTLCSLESFLVHWEECAVKNKSLLRKLELKERDSSAKPITGEVLENLLEIIAVVADGDGSIPDTISSDSEWCDVDDLCSLRDPCRSRSLDEDGSGEDSSSAYSYETECCDSRESMYDTDDDAVERGDGRNAGCVNDVDAFTDRNDGQGIYSEEGFEEEEEEEEDGKIFKKSRRKYLEDTEDDADSMSGVSEHSYVSTREVPPKLRDRKTLRPIYSFINETFNSSFGKSAVKPTSGKFDEKLKETTGDEKTSSESEVESDGDSLYCKVCQASFQTKRILLQHFAGKHLQPYTVKTVADSSSYFCHLCQKTFSTFMHYMQHVPNHSVTIYEKMKAFISNRKSAQRSERIASQRGLTKRNSMIPKMNKSLKSKRASTKSAVDQLNQQLLADKTQSMRERLRISKRKRSLPSTFTSSDDDYSSDASNNVVFKSKKSTETENWSDGQKPITRSSNARKQKSVSHHKEDDSSTQSSLDQSGEESARGPRLARVRDDDYVLSEDFDSDGDFTNTPPTTRSRKRYVQSLSFSNYKRRKISYDSDPSEEHVVENNNRNRQKYLCDADLSGSDADSNCSALLLSQCQDGRFVPSSNKPDTQVESCEGNNIKEAIESGENGRDLVPARVLFVRSLTKRQKERLKSCDLQPTVVLETMRLDNLETSIGYDNRLPEITPELQTPSSPQKEHVSAPKAPENSTSNDAPTSAAVKTSKDAPTSAAIDAPTSAAVKTSKDAPTSAAIDAPTSAAVKTSKDAPTSAAVKTSKDVPTSAAVKTSKDAPTSAAVETSKDAPTSAAIDAPTSAAIDAPTSAAVKTSKDAPTSAAIDAPTSAAVKTSKDVPTSAAVKTSKDVPTSAAVKTSKDAPTSAAVKTSKDAPTSAAVKTRNSSFLDSFLSYLNRYPSPEEDTQRGRRRRKSDLPCVKESQKRSNSCDVSHTSEPSQSPTTLSLGSSTETEIPESISETGTLNSSAHLSSNSQDIVQNILSKFPTRKCSVNLGEKLSLEDLKTNKNSLSQIRAVTQDMSSASAAVSASQKEKSDISISTPVSVSSSTPAAVSADQKEKSDISDPINVSSSTPAAVSADQKEKSDISDHVSVSSRSASLVTDVKQVPIVCLKKRDKIDVYATTPVVSTSLSVNEKKLSCKSVASETKPIEQKKPRGTRGSKVNVHTNGQVRERNVLTITTDGNSNFRVSSNSATLTSSFSADLNSQLCGDVEIETMDSTLVKLDTVEGMTTSMSPKQEKSAYTELRSCDFKEEVKAAAQLGSSENISSIPDSADNVGVTLPTIPDSEKPGIVTGSTFCVSGCDGEACEETDPSGCSAAQNHCNIVQKSSRNDCAELCAVKSAENVIKCVSENDCAELYAVKSAENVIKCVSENVPEVCSQVSAQSLALNNEGRSLKADVPDSPYSADNSAISDTSKDCQDSRSGVGHTNLISQNKHSVPGSVEMPCCDAAKLDQSEHHDSTAVAFTEAGRSYSCHLLDNQDTIPPVFGQCGRDTTSPVLGQCGRDTTPPILGQCGRDTTPPVLGQCGRDTTPPVLGQCGRDTSELQNCSTFQIVPLCIHSEEKIEEQQFTDVKDSEMPIIQEQLFTDVKDTETPRIQEQLFTDVKDTETPRIQEQQFTDVKDSKTPKTQDIIAISLKTEFKVKEQKQFTDTKILANLETHSMVAESLKTQLKVDDADLSRGAVKKSSRRLRTKNLQQSDTSLAIPETFEKVDRNRLGTTTHIPDTGSTVDEEETYETHLTQPENCEGLFPSETYETHLTQPENCEGLFPSETHLTQPENCEGLFPSETHLTQPENCEGLFPSETESIQADIFIQNQGTKRSPGQDDGYKVYDGLSRDMDTNKPAGAMEEAEIMADGQNSAVVNGNAKEVAGRCHDNSRVNVIQSSTGKERCVQGPVTDPPSSTGKERCVQGPVTDPPSSTGKERCGVLDTVTDTPSSTDIEKVVDGNNSMKTNLLDGDSMRTNLLDASQKNKTLSQGEGSAVKSRKLNEMPRKQDNKSRVILNPSISLAAFIAERLTKEDLEATSTMSQVQRVQIRHFDQDSPLDIGNRSQTGQDYPLDIGKHSLFHQDYLLDIGQRSQIDQDYPLDIGQLSQIDQDYPLDIGQLSQIDQDYPLDIGQRSQIDQDYPLDIGQRSQIDSSLYVGCCTPEPTCVTLTEDNPQLEIDHQDPDNVKLGHTSQSSCLVDYSSSESEEERLQCDNETNVATSGRINLQGFETSELFIDKNKTGMEGIKHNASDTPQKIQLGEAACIHNSKIPAREDGKLQELVGEDGKLQELVGEDGKLQELVGEDGKLQELVGEDGIQDKEIGFELPSKQIYEAARSCLTQCSVSSLPQCSVSSLTQCSVSSLPQCSVSSLPQCSVSSLPQCSVSSLPQCSVSSLPQCSVSKEKQLKHQCSISQGHSRPIGKDQCCGVEQARSCEVFESLLENIPGRTLNEQPERSDIQSLGENCKKPKTSNLTKCAERVVGNKPQVIPTSFWGETDKNLRKKTSQRVTSLVARGNCQTSLPPEKIGGEKALFTGDSESELSQNFVNKDIDATVRDISYEGKQTNSGKLDRNATLKTRTLSANKPDCCSESTACGGFKENDESISEEEVQVRGERTVVNGVSLISELSVYGERDVCEVVSHVSCNRVRTGRDTDISSKGSAVEHCDVAQEATCSQIYRENDAEGDRSVKPQATHASGNLGETESKVVDFYQEDMYDSQLVSSAHNGPVDMKDKDVCTINMLTTQTFSNGRGQIHPSSYDEKNQPSELTLYHSSQDKLTELQVTASGRNQTKHGTSLDTKTRLHVSSNQECDYENSTRTYTDKYLKLDPSPTEKSNEGLKKSADNLVIAAAKMEITLSDLSAAAVPVRNINSELKQTSASEESLSSLDPHTSNNTVDLCSEYIHADKDQMVHAQIQLSEALKVSVECGLKVKGLKRDAESFNGAVELHSKVELNQDEFGGILVKRQMEDFSESDGTLNCSDIDISKGEGSCSSEHQICEGSCIGPQLTKVIQSDNTTETRQFSQHCPSTSVADAGRSEILHKPDSPSERRNTDNETEEGDDFSDFDLVIENDTSYRSLSFPITFEKKSYSPVPLHSSSSYSSKGKTNYQLSSSNTPTPTSGLVHNRVQDHQPCPGQQPNQALRNPQACSKNLRRSIQGQFVWDADDETDSYRNKLLAEFPTIPFTSCAAFKNMPFVGEGVSNPALEALNRKQKALREKTETAPFTWDLEDFTDSSISNARGYSSVQRSSKIGNDILSFATSSMGQSQNISVAKAHRKITQRRRPLTPDVSHDKMPAKFRRTSSVDRQTKSSSSLVGKEPKKQPEGAVKCENETANIGRSSNDPVSKLSNISITVDEEVSFKIDPFSAPLCVILSADRQSPQTGNVTCSSGHETKLRRGERSQKQYVISQPVVALHNDRLESPIQAEDVVSFMNLPGLRSHHSSMESKSATSKRASECISQASHKRFRKNEDLLSPKLKKIGLIKITKESHSPPASSGTDCTAPMTRSSEAAIKAFNQKSLRSRGVNLVHSSHSQQTSPAKIVPQIIPQKSSPDASSKMKPSVSVQRLSPLSSNIVRNSSADVKVEPSPRSSVKKSQHIDNTTVAVVKRRSPTIPVTSPTTVHTKTPVALRSRKSLTGRSKSHHTTGSTTIFRVDPLPGTKGTYKSQVIPATKGMKTLHTPLMPGTTAAVEQKKDTSKQPKWKIKKETKLGRGKKQQRGPLSFKRT